MKTYILSILFIFTTLISFSQDSNSAIKKFGAAYNDRDISKMEAAADEYLSYESENSWPYIYKAFVLILKNDITNAKKYSQAAHHLYPILDSNYAIQSYIAFLEGNLAEAQRTMNFAYQLSFEENAVQNTIDELNMMEQVMSKDFSTLKTYAQEANAASKNSSVMIKQYNDCINMRFEAKSCDMDAALKYYNGFQTQNPTITLNAIYFKGLAHYKNAQWNDARTALETFVNHPDASKYASAYALATAYERLSWYDDFDANRLYLMTSKGLEALKKFPFSTYIKCDLLFRNVLALRNMGKEKEALAATEQLLKLATQLNYTRKIIEANNSIGVYYINNFSSNSSSLANQYLSKAYSDAIRFGDKHLENNVAINYAFALWKLGNKNRAIELTNKAYDYRVNNEQYDEAQNAANNLAFMLFATNDYTNAANFFRKAVSITEDHIKNMSASQRLVTMNNHSSAYSGLIMSLQKLNDAKALFRVQDMNRSRLLRTKLDKNLPSASLVQVQQNLSDDDVLLYYSQATPGEMIVNVITKTSASIGYNFPVDDWLLIKKKFINAVNKQPNSLNGYVTKLNEEIIDGVVYRHQSKENAFKAKDFDQFISLSRELLQSSDGAMKNLQDTFLKHWYTFLIRPIESKIAGKKRLIISAEGELNTMPFEAFMDSNNNYLIQKYDIKYIPSATVWLSLRNRTYSNSRKSLLAMGGATYQPQGSMEGSIRNANSLYELQDAITTKINTKNTNLSTELSALGFGGANYLPGTLREVENLKQIVPEAKILVGEQMKESDIKRLNTSNELANYKWLHIATHGFALNNIPELSGVMMTQPTHGDGNEDMFLLAHEIEGLNLNADLAVLSACETALGKSYGGEGINGLNSALLTAGANNTLLSLWPVNDSGTMIFMTEVYNNLHNGNMSVEDATNQAKRKMLSGVYGAEFATPVIWAPFVLNGK